MGQEQASGTGEKNYNRTRKYAITRGRLPGGRLPESAYDKYTETSTSACIVKSFAWGYMAGKKPAKSPKLDDAVGEGEEGAPGEAETSEKHQQVLERIVNIQNEIDALNERASEEILHVEQKYNRLRQPHFERRSELIKELPDFWATAVSSRARGCRERGGEGALPACRGRPSRGCGEKKA